MLKNFKLTAVALIITTVLSGCVTVEDFLENLGLKRSDKVQTVYLNPIRANYEIVSTANVRAAPSMNAEVVGTLAAGQRFLAIGSTGEWIAIGDRDSNILGYVHASLVKEVSKKRTRKTTKASKPAETQTANDAQAGSDEKKSDSMNLDDIPEKKASPSASSPAPANSTKAGSVNLDDL